MELRSVTFLPGAIHGQTLHNGVLFTSGIELICALHLSFLGSMGWH